MTARRDDPWFDGKTAVVTGGAHGIGRSTAELLAELGAAVIAVDVDGDALQTVFSGHSVTPFVADVASESESLAETLVSEFGPIDLLVNNVGIDTPHHFLELGELDWDRVFRVNVRGPWFLTHGIAKRMVKEGRSGSIVFVSSLHDSFIRTLPHYSASKAAVAMLVKELANELGPHGVRVNAVSPGVIHTARVPLPVDEQEQSRLRSLIPLGAMGEPLQVARMIAVLLNDQWSEYVTGANIPVDGGLGLHSWSVDRS